MLASFVVLKKSLILAFHKISGIMKIIKKIKEVAMSKNKKDKKKLAKKIDKKILKALKERYLKAKKEKQEAKSAYELAKSFFEKNNPSKKTKSKKSKKKVEKSKNQKIKDTSTSATPIKPASNAVVTSLSDLPPTPSKISHKLPKPLRIKKAKPVSKKATPKPTTRTRKTTPKNTVKKIATPKPTPKPVAKPIAKKPRTIVRKATPKRTTPPKISEKQMGDLKVVEGIGPAIERLLKSNDIKTLAVLSKTRIAVLRKILSDAGPRYRFHKPDTWARQARLAAAGKWKELDALQKVLDGGKKK